MDSLMIRLRRLSSNRSPSKYKGEGLTRIAKNFSRSRNLRAASGEPMFDFFVHPPDSTLTAATLRCGGEEFDAA